jgi:hypothetical protein
MAYIFNGIKLLLPFSYHVILTRFKILVPVDFQITTNNKSNRFILMINNKNFNMEQSTNGNHYLTEKI